MQERFEEEKEAKAIKDALDAALQIDSLLGEGQPLSALLNRMRDEMAKALVALADIDPTDMASVFALRVRVKAYQFLVEELRIIYEAADEAAAVIQQSDENYMRKLFESGNEEKD